MRSPHPLALALVLSASLATTACVDDGARPEFDQALADDLELPAGPDGGKADDAFEQRCPGMTRGVPSWRGLHGRFVFDDNSSAEIAAVEFMTTVDDVDASGPVWVALSFPKPSRAFDGHFRALSDNPAIGPILSFDTDNDGIHDYGRIVVGARIDETGPTHICMLGERGLYKLRRR